MIVAIFIIILEFVWIGYETDWMRVRLLVGPEAKVIKQPRKRFKPVHCKDWHGLSPGIKLQPEQSKWIKWAYQHPELVNPPCHLELRINGCRYDMNIIDTKIMKEVVKVNIQKHQPINGIRLYKG